MASGDQAGPERVVGRAGRADRADRSMEDPARSLYLDRRWRDDAKLMRYAALIALLLHPFGILIDYAVIGDDPRLVPLLIARLVASVIHVPIVLACFRLDKPSPRIDLLAAVGFVVSVFGGVLMPTILRPTTVASQGGPLLILLTLYALVFPAWRAHKVAVFMAVSMGYVGIGLYWMEQIGYGGSGELITLTILLVAVGILIPRASQRIEQTEFKRFLAQEELTRTIVQLKEEVALREQRERALEIAREQAEYANRSKTSFMASVSHELRTPLVGILGVAELMRGGEGQDSDERERVELLRQSGEYLLRLVNDLLDYFKLEAGKIELDDAPLSPRSFANAAIDLIRPSITQPGVELRLEIDPQLPEWVLGDGLRVQQIMINLVGNAVKFTESGFVALRLLRSGEGPGQRLIIEIEDSGIGMDSSFVERMFEPFEQAAETRRRPNSSGLGLAITHRFVEQMRGTIEVASERGMGTTIRVQLPLCPCAAPTGGAAGAAVIAAREPARSLRVLIAEDNPVNAKILRGILRKMGHVVTVAHDGAQLLEHAERERFDIILTDVFMPVLNGIEATEKLRLLPSPHNTTPVLALTADAFEERHAALREAGVDDVLVKPVSVQVLARALEHHAR